MSRVIGALILLAGIVAFIFISPSGCSSQELGRSVSLAAWREGHAAVSKTAVLGSIPRAADLSMAAWSGKRVRQDSPRLIDTQGAISTLGPVKRKVVTEDKPCAKRPMPKMKSRAEQWHSGVLALRAEGWRTAGRAADLSAGETTRPIRPLNGTGKRAPALETRPTTHRALPNAAPSQSWGPAALNPQKPRQADGHMNVMTQPEGAADLAVHSSANPTPRRLS